MPAALLYGISDVYNDVAWRRYGGMENVAGNHNVIMTVMT